MDSDDLMAPHCLAQRSHTMVENPHLDCCLFRYQYLAVGSLSEIHHTSSPVDPRSPLLAQLNIKDYFNTSAPIWKRSSILDIGGYNERLICSQDDELAARVLGSSMVIGFQDSFDFFIRNAQDPEKMTARPPSRQMVISRMRMIEVLFNSYLRAGYPYLISCARIAAIRLESALAVMRSTLRQPCKAAIRLAAPYLRLPAIKPAIASLFLRFLVILLLRTQRIRIIGGSVRRLLRTIHRILYCYMASFSDKVRHYTISAKKIQ